MSKHIDADTLRELVAALGRTPIGYNREATVLLMLEQAGFTVDTPDPAWPPTISPALRASLVDSLRYDLTSDGDGRIDHTGHARLKRLPNEAQRKAQVDYILKMAGVRVHG